VLYLCQSSAGKVEIWAEQQHWGKSFTMAKSGHSHAVSLLCQDFLTGLGSSWSSRKPASLVAPQDWRFRWSHLVLVPVTLCLQGKWKWGPVTNSNHCGAFVYFFKLATVCQSRQYSFQKLSQSCYMWKSCSCVSSESVLRCLS